MKSHQKRLQSELDRIVSVLAKKYKPQKIIAFGSIVSGKLKEWSDLDLLLVKDTKKRFPDRIGEILNIVEPREAVDFLVYTPEEFEAMSKNNYFIKDEVVNKGKVIYG